MDLGTLALLTILNVVIAALVSSLTALGVSYFRTRGQNLATKHDFEDLQEQLSATTKLVETIKSDVGQRDWAQREWSNLRRTKLETLMEKMHECEVYLSRKQHSALAGELLQPELSPISKADELAALYLPELKNEVDSFTLVCRQELVMMGDLASGSVQQNRIVTRPLCRPPTTTSGKHRVTERCLPPNTN
jgi:hypothetical protein